MATTPIRYSTYNSVAWNGKQWVRADASITQMQTESLRIQAEVSIGNADGAIGSYILTNGIQDVPIKIWGYDAAAIGTPDPVLLCDGVGASAEIGLMDARIKIRHKSEFEAPLRTYINSSNGFNTLQPAGVVFKINGQDVKLSRRGK